MILDCHSHIASFKYFPVEFFRGWSDTIKRTLPYSLSDSQSRKLDLLFDGLMDDSECERLSMEMDEAGITKSILLVIDFGITYKKYQDDIEEIHKCHVEIMSKTDKFIGFSGVDPRRGKEGIDLFEKAVTKWGFKGLKLYPPCGYSPSDSLLDPYYEICSSMGLPVLVHIGPTSAALPFRFSQPIELDSAAHRFPKVNFIMGHAGVTQYQEAALLAQYRPNIYLDISGFQGELNHGQFSKIMKWNISKGLSKRVLFGTDWPIHRFFGRQKKWVEAVKDLERQHILSKQDLENIMFNNLHQILFSEAQHGAK
ncbi:amidohydrolase family protein [Paenibacillus polysaccharolyticus]|uniref:Amidohydrolase n=2 Tax=Paenibacillus cucumis (ex Kampfer et al. 2016) TaxID=1776858 RepID=A0ABS7KP13_9BACL|nr:amidohydrolase [Paenibacillus cucumis (ex Kampfer et al. 2016)]MDP9699118.1 putative TIM-barrel fold metal-dependent hydrolase [Paenibacillus intestini]